MRTKDNPDDPLRRLHGECFEDEVTHLLVSTAAFNRVYRMQRHPRRISPDNITIEPVQGPCGNLWIDSHDPQSQQPLSFKVAVTPRRRAPRAPMRPCLSGQSRFRLGANPVAGLLGTLRFHA
jgi:hypothetical protein